MISEIIGLVGKFMPDPKARQELELKLLENKSEIEKQFTSLAGQDHALRMKEIETNGFKSLWRPCLMFSFGVIVTMYSLLYYILPGLLSQLGVEPSLILLDPPEVDPALWDLVKYSVLGLGGMRTVDKMRRGK